MDKRKKIKRIIYNVLLVISLSVFVYSAFQVGSLFYKYHKQDEEIEQMQNVAKVPKNPEKKEFAIDWKNLQATNPDIIGWILIPDTNISHALVQGNDNDYYLTHTPQKSYLYSGSIFMDYRAKSDFSGKNTIIYGHNVLYGTMFAQIEKFKNESFFNTHPYVYIYTPTQCYRCEVVYFHNTTNESPCYQIEFSNDADFDNYLKTIQSLATFKNDIPLTTNDHVITLSTCSYEKDGRPSEMRYILQLRLTPYQGKYIPETN